MINGLTYSMREGMRHQVELDLCFNGSTLRFNTSLNT
jgi:hypothetical protein